MDRRNLACNLLEYEDIIAEMSDEQLKDELDAAKKALEQAEDEYETNRRMIDAHMDDPGYEHLIDMSIRESAKPYDIAILKEKIRMLESAVKSKTL